MTNPVSTRGSLTCCFFVSGSATLHAWQQLAQPHMGAMLDHRPGVVTKGFRTLPHEQEQGQEDSWELDQPEEDEVSCDSFAVLSEENSTSLDLSRSTSSVSTCGNINVNTDDSSQSEMLPGERCEAKEAIQGKDGHIGSMPILPSSASTSSSPSSSSKMNGHVDVKELQALKPGTADHMPGEGAS